MALKTENVRDQVLVEIRRLAELNGGQAPGSRTFARETGINQKQWQGKYWARWTDAVADAGLKPNSGTEKIGNDTLLKMLAESVRHYAGIPTSMELRMYRNIDPAFPTDRTICKRYPTKDALVLALSQWVSENEGFNDLTEMLAQDSPTDKSNTVDQPKEGFVYLIRSGSHFKIGRSDELERRIKEIRVALPDAATLVHSIRTDDPGGIESYWHRRFADRRANGEWFKLSTSDIAAFKRRKFQ
jgi:Meiotically up-regulated gene 113